MTSVRNTEVVRGHALTHASESADSTTTQQTPNTHRHPRGSSSPLTLNHITCFSVWYAQSLLLNCLIITKAKEPPLPFLYDSATYLTDATPTIHPPHPSRKIRKPKPAGSKRHGSNAALRSHRIWLCALVHMLCGLGKITSPLWALVSSSSKWR